MNEWSRTPFVILAEKSILLVLAYFSIDLTIHHGQITPAAVYWHPTFKPLHYLSTSLLLVLYYSPSIPCASTF